MNFPLRTLLSLKVTGNRITGTGRDELYMLLTRQICLRDPEWSPVLPANYDPYEYGKARLPNPPGDWIWEWLVDRKDHPYRGTFQNRYSAFVKKAAELKLPNIIKEKIGNLARRHTESDQEYLFDFTDEINWKAGSFGDDGSCFWGGRSVAKNMIEDNGGLAIRFFSSNGRSPGAIYKGVGGYARAWLIPNYPKEGMFIVWNGYGIPGDATQSIAKILSQYFQVSDELSYRDVSLRNFNNDSSTLYINGGRGILIGRKAEIEGYNRINLEWRNAIGECAHCRVALYEGEERRHGGYLYCNSCFEDRFSQCECCGEWENIDNFHEVIAPYDNRSHTVMFCETCYERRVITCDHCGNEVDQDNALYLDGESELICFVCRPNTTVCPQCNCFHWNEHMTPFGGRMLCETCLPSNEENLINEQEIG